MPFDAFELFANALLDGVAAFHAMEHDLER
jgi:hypothetical protein